MTMRYLLATTTALLLAAATITPATADVAPTDDFVQPCFIVPLLHDQDTDHACLWEDQLKRRADVQECRGSPEGIRPIVAELLLTHYIVTGKVQYVGRLLANENSSSGEKTLASCLLSRAGDDAKVTLSVSVGPRVGYSRYRGGLVLSQFCSVSLNGITAIKESEHGTKTQRRVPSGGDPHSADERA